jgi:predicted nucleic acid-binding protein
MTPVRTRPIVLDTSFLIAYADPKREFHEVAKKYLRECIRLNVPMLVSTIVVAEFERKQPLSDLGLHNFRFMPFNFDEAQEAARLAEAIFPNDKARDRVALAADVKILAQAKLAGARALLTEDASSMAAYLDSLRDAKLIDCYAVLTRDGFDPSALVDPRAPELPLDR